MNSLFTVHAIIPFFTLVALELVLGIDNIIFISLICERLPAALQKKARTIGLLLAIITRVLLLISLSWVMSLTAPLFQFFGQEISGKDLILILGGLFLIAKSTHEIHQKFETERRARPLLAVPKSQVVLILLQILLLDMVFSLDSVITAVGMVNTISVMVAAVISSTLVMIFAVNFIADFLAKRPSIKVLALSFLVLIGVALLAEGFDTHIPKGYIYFSMAYALIVESVNIRLRKKPA